MYSKNDLMDAYEATKLVMSRIQSIDREHASKIMGYILIQDQGEKEMIRLAFCPDALLLSYINQAKTCLRLHSNSPSSKSLNPFSNSVRPNNILPRTSPGTLNPNDGFDYCNPSSPSFPRSNPRPISYAAVLNGYSTGANNSSNSDSRSSNLKFYGGNDFGDELLNAGGGGGGVVDQIMSPKRGIDPLIFPTGEDWSSIPSPQTHPLHRRSCSVNDSLFLSHLEEGGGGGGFGCRPCMYFAKGFCKNGSACKFFHGDMESPSTKASGFVEFFRMKAIQQQQRFELMGSGVHHPSNYNKCMNFLNDNQRCGPRNEFSQMEVGAAASSSRQIYLTFPADSTFKEKDVSSYFSMFGPVLDVRIPYQQKRMFGFVTFVYSETVKLILEKGNPHYVCDSRVLVKPYKEKGKVTDKKQLQRQHQYFDWGEYSSFLSSSGIDSKEFFDFPIGSRMLLNTQEMMLKRKLEEAELQHAIELQGRRMMNLQLMHLKHQQHNNRFLPLVPTGVSISSPRQSQLVMSENVFSSSDAGNQDISQEFDDGQATSKSSDVASDDDKLVLEGTGSSTKNNIFIGDKHLHVNDDSYLPGSLEHILPDNHFAPTKSLEEHQSRLSYASAEVANSLTITSS